jgi:hypothetical protein
VTARLSDPENDPPLKPTEADAFAVALPVWNVPPDAVIERTTVCDTRSQTGVKDALPVAVPCVTVTDDDWPVAPAGHAVAMAIFTPPPDVPVSWPWSAIRATTLGWTVIVRELLPVIWVPFFAMRTNACASALPRSMRFPLTTLERLIWGSPVHVPLKVPEPPGSSGWKM